MSVVRGGDVPRYDPHLRSEAHWEVLSLRAGHLHWLDPLLRRDIEDWRGGGPLMGRRRNASTILPCGHRLGECGECLRCGRCYLGFAEDHFCPDGRTGGHVQMPDEPEPSPLWDSLRALRLP